MTAQERHDAIKKICRDETLSDAEALRQIAQLTPPTAILEAIQTIELRLLELACSLYRQAVERKEDWRKLSAVAGDGGFIPAKSRFE